jgi:hypothetical protein
VKGEQQLFGSFFKQVYQQQVKGIRREVVDGIAAYIGRLRMIEWREGMGYVY